MITDVLQIKRQVHAGENKCMTSRLTTFRLYLSAQLVAPDIAAFVTTDINELEAMNEVCSKYEHYYFLFDSI